MKKKVAFIILFVSAVISLIGNHSGFAAEHTRQNGYSISNFEILEDPKGSYRFDEICKGDYANQYIAYPEKTISLGITDSVYWIRFKLLAPVSGKPVAGQLLQLDNPNIDKISLYIPIADKNESHYIVKEVGVSRPAENKDIMSNTWVFQLTNEFDNEQFVYLRLESTSALRLPVRVWNANDFMEETMVNNLGFGAFYGILLGMLVYNFFVFLALRDKVYLFYILYVGFMFLYQFQVHGHLKLFFDIPYRLYNGIFWAWLAAAFVCSIYFTRQFLQVKASFPRLDKIFTGAVILSILQGILGVLGYNLWANQIAHGLGIFGPIFIMTVAIIRFFQGFKPARYYIIARGVLAIGIIIWSLSAYLSGIFSSVNYLLLATTSESVLLSVALIDRVGNLRRKKKILGEKVKWYRELSFIDGLTGLYNKRFLDIKIDKEINSALQGSKPMSLLIIDVDHFKSYNDTYGHWEGDQVLTRLDEFISQKIQTGQTAFRYGGEEFILLLPDTTGNTAKGIAEELRQAFMNEEFFPGMKSAVTVTISIGVAELLPEDKWESLFQRADEALYIAKKNGRNQTVLVQKKHTSGEAGVTLTTG